MTVVAKLIFVALFSVVFLRIDDPVETAKVKEPELRVELLGLVKMDQEARMALISWMKEQGRDFGADKPAFNPEEQAKHDELLAAVKKSDQLSSDRLRAVIDQYGWPTNTLIGKDGSHAAWLLVQHADADVKFQRKCLDLMTKLPGEEISQTDLAYLTDRVLLAEGKKQLYGTQFKFAGGKWEPSPLEDPDNVDKRRAEVGMQTIAEYAKELQAVYGGSPK